MNTQIPRYDLPDNEQIRVSSLVERHIPKYFSTHRHKYYEIVIITSCVEGDFSHSIDFVSYPHMSISLLLVKHMLGMLKVIMENMKVI